MTNEADETLIELLRTRNGTPTEVALRDGQVLLVMNIAWGYDDGENCAHVTTNISPGTEGVPVAFFITDAVALVRNPADGSILFRA